MGVEPQGARAGQGAPPLLGAIVDRSALVARLDACLYRRLGLVVAPAGSGKTVLLSQWLARHPELPSAWLSLERRHNEGGRFARDLLEALRAVVPDLAAEAALAELASGGLSLGESFVDTLSTELAVAPPFALVLDDFHMLVNPPLVHDLGRLIQRLPSAAHVLIASRSDPGLPIQRMRLGGEIVAIREGAMAFDVPDARNLLASVGAPPIGDELVDALVVRTEGWAAGLQLAGLSLREAPDIDRFVAEFAGDDRFVADYLTEEVLGHQSPQLRSFLLRTSVLPTFSAELADAVTGGDGAAAELIDELQRQALFIVPVGLRQGWFRYHQMFAELLRYHLSAEARGLDRELQVRAAVWHLERGDWRAAEEYLLVARAWDLALDVALDHGRELFEQSDAGTLLGWLEVIGAGPTGTDLVTQLALMLAQVASDHAFAAEETYRRLARRNDLDDGERVCADAFFSALVMFHLPPDVAIDAAEGVLARLPGLVERRLPDLFGLTDRDSIEFVARLMRAKALAYAGRDAEAGRALEEAGQSAGVRYPIWRIHLLGSAALFRAFLGDLATAHHEATEALDVAREMGVLAHVALADAYLALGAIAVERHDLDAASLHLEEGRTRAERSRRFAILDIHRILRSRLDAATAGYREALATLCQQPAGPFMNAATAELQAVLEVRFLVGAGELPLARTALARLHAAPGSSSRLPVEAVSYALAAGEVGEARRALDLWDAPPESRMSEVERGVREAMVLDAEGDTPQAIDCLAKALALAEPELLRRPFLDAGAAALKLLRHLERGRPSAFARSVLEAELSTGSRRDAARRLVDPLTDRELAVLHYLPGRLSNAEVAAALYVSLNTLKTHLRNIYRKLEVTDRDRAVDRASELGLL